MIRKFILGLALSLALTTPAIAQVAVQVTSPSGAAAAPVDANGLVVQSALATNTWSYAAVAGGIVSSTADVTVKAAGAATVRNYVCTLDVSHDLLSAVTEMVVKDGASTVMWRGKLQTPAMDISGGAGKLTFMPCLRGSLATAVNVALTVSVTGGVYVNVTGNTGS
jgi:hypothetical protein